MGRKYKIRNQDEIYFVTFTVILWLDIFTRTCYKNIILESLKYCQKQKGLEIYAWVIMTNHIHLIIGTKGVNKLEEIIRDFKKYTSKKIISEIKENRKDMFLFLFKKYVKQNSKNKEYQFWQQHNHPIELSNIKLVEQRLNYMHENPVRAGFVEENYEWLYSSVRDYENDKKGLLKIKYLY